MAETIPADVIGQLRQIVADWKRFPTYQKAVEPRDGVLARFQPVFSPDHVPAITEEEFQPFLLDKNNHHWTGLHRQGTQMCSDMPALRSALTLLLDEDQPLADRLDKATSMIAGLGKNIVSAILLTAFPEYYGVWNNRSEANMKRLGIWPKFDRGESFGSRYAKVNEVLLQLRDALDIDLWTLDYLWWHLDQLEAGAVGGGNPDDIEAVLSLDEEEHKQRFGLERHLHEFLRDNWEHTELGREWSIYQEPGDEEVGYEYPCDVGRIDLLAKHRTEPHWLVVELKRNQTSDQTIGQLLRYIGWVKQHLAEDGDQVYGMIICHEIDDALQYALSTVQNVELRLYEVEFHLRTAETISGASPQGKE